MTECPSCNYRNPSHVSTCMTCGRSLKKVRNNPGAAVVYPVAANLQSGIHRTKMAVFDIDDTLFDASQRETNAKRAGLAPATPYTGDRKPSDYPKGKKAFMDFFNSPKQFRIDPITPGALDYVRTLVRDGYTIAYLTGRPNTYFNATMQHLKESGFPVFNDGNGQPLLFMKPSKKKKTTQFKYEVMRNLQGKFDIHYFYDDLKGNRDIAFQLGVIGVYDLRDRLDVRNNPGHNCGCGQTPCKTYGTRSNPTQLERFLQEQKEEEEGRKMGVMGGTTASASTYRWRGNPNTEVPEGYRQAAGCIVQRGSDKKILLLRRSIYETSHHGMYELPGGKLEEGETPKEAALIETKEEAGLDVRIVQTLQPHIDHNANKVYHGFVGAPKKGAKVKISEEHDEYKWVSIKQAFAMPSGKLSHHARFLLQQMLGEPPLPNPLPKPRKKNGRKEPSKKFVDRMMGNTKMRAEFPDAGQRYAVTLRLVENHYGKAARKKIAPRDNGFFSRSNPSDVLPIYSGEPKGKSKNLGAVFSEVVIGRNIVKDVGEAVQSIYRGLIGGRTSMAEKRLAMGVASMQKELSDNARKLGGNALANLKMDYEVLQGTATISIIATADAIKMARAPKKNPRMPLDGMEDKKKVKKAKTQYKKFHGGKDPVSIKTEKIDVGDVWYSLGPCWSIGYMSPKETGDDEQKYIHHTNEDSKDGNFPMMYATMPESGEPMIVIKGGSMKIGMRDGLAWLID